MKDVVILLLRAELLLLFYSTMQIYSQCNIYEAGEKKVAFKYLSEKVNNPTLTEHK